MLFEDLEGGGEVVVGGFGEEEVDVLGHEDVAVDLYSVFFPGLFENLFDDLFGVVGS